eukprot:1160975-Pelagomonas_calceolata.AAC.2
MGMSRWWWDSLVDSGWGWSRSEQTCLQLLFLEEAQNRAIGFALLFCVIEAVVNLVAMLQKFLPRRTRALHGLDKKQKERKKERRKEKKEKSTQATGRVH